ncbi:MAG TPA: 2-dehydropantoate 2-reductase N-terminal domain-containing protein, partial [Rubrivivax sp.]|nr:2-dehydropantoate 2-reductase N-terminal domain-containing protein [Rubrivivax sp.]
MKVCIVGLGAIGGLFAGWLGTRLPAAAAAMLQLSALARGETLATVQRHGLRLDTAGGTVHVPLQASGDAAALGPQ